MAEFLDWLAFYQLEPWGEDRADLRMGILACCVSQPYTKKSLRPKDFIPQFTKQKQDWKALKASFEAYAARLAAQQRNDGDKLNS